jgi:uncharacterized damage-inducible protein DinB
LLGHDRWTTEQVLASAAGLSEAQLDQDFDLGHRTLRATLRHLIGNVETWTDLMAERPVRGGRAETPTLAALRAQYAAAAEDFAQVARELRAAGRLNALYTDVLDNPPAQKSVGGTILHVLTHNHQHRAELLHMLARLGVEGLVEGDVLSWEGRLKG